MIEGFEYSGEWWLPDNPEKQIFGQLRFDPYEGATLDLIGSLRDYEDITRIYMLEPDIILGISSKNEKVTLYDCLQTKFEAQISLSGKGSSSFYAHMVFVGAHFQKPEDIKFKNVTIYYLHMDEWVGIYGFDIQLPTKGGTVVEYKRPESIIAKVADYELAIIFEASYPIGPRKKVSIEQKTLIRIEPSEDKSISEFLNIVRHMQNFLSLGTLEPIYPLEVYGTAEARKTTMKNGKTHYPPINIYYQMPVTPSEPKTISSHNMLFTFSDIKEQPDTYLQNWIRQAESLKPVHDLYFGTLYNPHMYLEQKFLNYTQAIESYHRRTVDNFVLPEDEHKLRIAKIIDAVSEEQKDWLRQKLAYSNEPSFRKRLKYIVDKYSNVLGKIDQRKFINKVLDTRNYLTHYDLKQKDVSAVGAELYKLTNKLKKTVVICLLNELGFSLEFISERISSRIR